MRFNFGGEVIKLTISRLITTVITIVSAMILSRYLSLGEYGTYSQLIMLTNIFSGLLMLGLPNSINFFLVNSNLKEKERFLSVYYSFSTVAGCTVGLLLVVLTPFFVQYFDNVYLKGCFFFLAVYPWTRIINTSLDNILIVYKKIKLLMLSRVINALLILLVLIITVIFELNFYVYLVFFIGVESLFALSVYVIVKKVAGHFSFTIDFPLMKKILQYSIPIGLASMVGTINIELDKLFIGFYMNTEMVAIYSNASRELPVTIISASLVAILLPRLIEILKQNRVETAVELWSRTTALSFFVLCFFVSVFYVFAPEILAFFYSDKYASGVTIFRIYSIAILLKCTYFGMVLNAIGKTKFILYSSLASLMLNVVFNFIGFHMFGFIGPALATLFSQLSMNLLQLVATSKVIKIKFVKLFPWKSVFFILILNLCLSALFSAVKGSMEAWVAINPTVLCMILFIPWLAIVALGFRKYLSREWNLINRNY